MDEILQLPDSQSMRKLAHITALDQSLGEFYIDVTCSCGHGKMYKLEDIQKLFGKTATFEHIKTRLVCSKCKKKDMDICARAIPRPRGHNTH